MFEKFTHNGREFEIRHYYDGMRIKVKAFLNDQQVSPEYSADTDVASDFFQANGEHILKSLKGIVKSDIENGIYIQI